MLNHHPYDLPDAVWPTQRATDRGARLYLIPQRGSQHFLQYFLLIPFPNRAPLGPFWKWNINNGISPICPVPDIWIIPETWCFDENEILCSTIVSVTINSVGLDYNFERVKTYCIIDAFSYWNEHWALSLVRGKSHFFPSPPERNWEKQKHNLKQSSSLGSGLDFSTKGEFPWVCYLYSWGKHSGWRLQRGLENTGSIVSWC